MRSTNYYNCDFAHNGNVKIRKGKDGRARVRLSVEYSTHSLPRDRPTFTSTDGRSVDFESHEKEEERKDVRTQARNMGVQARNYKTGKWKY